MFAAQHVKAPTPSTMGTHRGLGDLSHPSQKAGLPCEAQRPSTFLDTGGKRDLKAMRLAGDAVGPHLTHLST